MADFPRLRTGAVAQYPTRRSIAYRTEAIRFIDGTEQRFRNYGTPLKQWVIELEALDDSEMSEIAKFYEETPGTVVFSFTDPWDGVAYPSCSIDDELTEDFREEGRGRTRLVIRENRNSC